MSIAIDNSARHTVKDTTMMQSAIGLGLVIEALFLRIKYPIKIQLGKR